MINYTILLFFFINIVANSQTATTGGFEKSGFLVKEELESKFDMSDMTKEKFAPTSDLVISEYYFLGPNDVILLKVSPSLKNNNMITVSPDNKLILPRANVTLDVTNKTLKDIEIEVDSVYKSLNSNSQVSISLFNPRMCLITVEGNVKNPKTYVVPASYTVATVINLANSSEVEVPSNIKNEDYFIQKRLREKNLTTKNKEIHNNPELYTWKRNVVLIRNNSKSQIVDIEKAESLNDNTFNPYIMGGDKIFVPYPEDNIPTISISGAILRPISTELKYGDKLSLIVKMGRGLLPEADLDNVYYFSNGKKEKIKLDNNLNLLSEDKELRNGDRVIIQSKRKAVEKKYGLVSVKGFVNDEGVYPIEEGISTLSEILDLAGGVSENAFLAGAYVKRKDYENRDLKYSRTEALKLFRNSMLSVEDTLRYFADVYALDNTLSFDLSAILNGNKDADVTLRDGDEIYIPTFPNKVQIFGRVQRPGIVSFEKGKTLKWYLDKVGGYTETADKSRIAIIRMNNESWIDDLNEVVQDGDYIYVPGFKDKSIQAEQAEYATIAAITGAAASLLFVVISLINTLNRD